MSADGVTWALAADLSSLPPADRAAARLVLLAVGDSTPPAGYVDPVPVRSVCERVMGDVVEVGAVIGALLAAGVLDGPAGGLVPGAGWSR